MEIGRTLRTLTAALLVPAGPVAAGQTGMWVTAYYAAWRQSHLRPEEIDWSALTHLVHFSLNPRPDGSLDADVNRLGPANVAEVVKAAHAAGKKVLFAVGGKRSRAGFLGAMNAAHRAAFIDNLLAFLTRNGYDGIDVDMEEIRPGDAEGYAAFIRELRRRLDALRPRPLLTAPVLWEPALFARLANEFDQINLMTYDLAGPYPGWVLWHSGALYDGGRSFPDRRERLPSVDNRVEAFLAAGVPRAKLGVGVSFYGYVWNGTDASRPGEGWSSPPGFKNLPYYRLADDFGLREYEYSHPAYHWDDKAQAAYLSIEDGSPGGGKFVSYDNEVAARKKVEYAQRKGLGGVIIWELGGGYRDSQEKGRRDLLLQAVKRAAFGGGGLR